MIQRDINGIYPLVICYIAIENGPVEIVGFHIKSMVIFQFVFCMFTRGYMVELMDYTNIYQPMR